MSRKTTLLIHIMATVLSLTTISIFFSLSLYAEIRGGHELIKSVKTFIVYSLPVLIIAMPTLMITGNKLAENLRSKLVSIKKRRMKLMSINAIALISIAIILYIRADNDKIDHHFFGFRLQS